MSPPFDPTTTECTVTGKDVGVIGKTSGYNSPGQGIRQVRGRTGKPTELWVGGTKLLPKEAMVKEALGKYRKTGRTGRTGRPGKTAAR